MKTLALTSLPLALAGSALWPSRGCGVTPTEFELGDAARWAAAKFKAVVDSTKPSVGLYVLANNDPGN